MKNVIVTGGAGFIGHHLVNKLYSIGYNILVIDNLSSGLINNLNFNKNIYFKKIDIRDNLEDLFFEFKPEIIFHLAAIPSVPFSIQNKVLTNDVNVSGTLNLLELSLKNNVKRFIFSSSSSVYGGTRSDGPSLESDIPNPMSPYALQKLIGEQYCKLYSSYGLDTCILRYFNVFGEVQRPDSSYAAVIPSFLNHKVNNTIPIIYGDGEQMRDFCHVSNIVEANICAAKRIAPIYGEVFNIGSGHNISINDVARFFNFKYIKYLPARDGDIKISLSDISKAKALLGFNILKNFNHAINDLIYNGVVE